MINVPLYANKVNRWVLAVNSNDLKSSREIAAAVEAAFRNWFSTNSLTDFFHFDGRAGFARNIQVVETSLSRIRFDSAVVANRSMAETIVTLKPDSAVVWVKVEFDWRGGNNGTLKSWPAFNGIRIDSQDDNDIILDTVSLPLVDSTGPKDDSDGSVIDILSGASSKIFGVNPITVGLIGAIGLYLYAARK